MYPSRPLVLKMKRRKKKKDQNKKKQEQEEDYNILNNKMKRRVQNAKDETTGIYEKQGDAINKYKKFRFAETRSGPS